MRRPLAFLCGIAVGAAVGALVVPAAAQAIPVTKIQIPSGEIHFIAGDGQTNHVIVTKLTGPAHIYRFQDSYPITFDDIYPISAGACTYPYAGDQTVMDCDWSASIINVKTGDLDDAITYQVAVSWQLEPGSGDDVVRTGTGAGNPGNYTAGGDGDDIIYSGPGDEYISGGPGIDTVTYVGRWNPIIAAVSGGGGEAGESDGYDQIENITGGGAGDTLTGNSGANVLDGGWATTPCLPYPTVAPGALIAAAPPCTSSSGDDNLSGGGGADTLVGRAGDDILAGGAGYDALDGGSGTGDWCYIDADGGTRTGCEYPIIIIWPY